MTQNNTAGTRRDYIVSITIIGLLFFIFGFVTWLNSTLITFLKTACELSNVEAYLVTFAFYISYFVMALPSSWVLHKTGFKGGMALGLIVMAAGTLFFIPAAMNREYGLFLTGLFIQGTGLAILQTASNPYVTILGPYESAARRISIMGICNKVAGAIGPLILGAIVLKDADVMNAKLTSITDAIQRSLLLDQMATRVIMPYTIMAIVLVVIALLVRFSPLPDIDTDKADADLASDKRKNIFHFPHLILGFFAIFFYVGAEVIAGDSIILYGNKGQGIAMEAAKVFTSYTLIAMVIGYIIGILLMPRIIKQERALAISSVLSIVFTLAALFTQGFTSVFFIAILGLSNAVMWPAIWPLAMKGLGRFTKTGSALLIMGIAGGATIPLLYGRLADIPYVGYQTAYWILVPCYIFILYYAVSGHKLKIRSDN